MNATSQGLRSASERASGDGAIRSPFRPLPAIVSTLPEARSTRRMAWFSVSAT